MRRLNDLGAQVAKMLDSAPCPVSETLLAHHVRVDDGSGGITALDAVRDALHQLEKANEAVYVRHDKLASRWPPQAFSAYKHGDHDDAVQLAIGAWASKANCHNFDQIVKDAHLPSKKRVMRPYEDIGWWGRLEPSPEFVADAEQVMKAHARLLGY